MRRKPGKILATVLATALLFGSMSVAAPTTKTMTVNFEEVLNGNAGRSKTVDIPNLKSVDVKSVTGSGSATLGVNGNKVTVTVKGGTPSRVVTNPKKESKVVSSTLTSSNSSSFPTTDSYNSGGFSGTLNRQGSPERYTITTEGGSSTYCGKQCYNRGGTWEEEDRCYDDCTSSNTEYRYRQTYSGTVYKSGPDNYYSYSVALNYIDNTTPTIATGTLPTITINANGEITITGTVTDPDDDTITISSAINGVTKSITVPGPTSNKPWSLTWIGTELAEGTYTTATVTANDGKGGVSSTTYNGTVIVDKTKPVINVNVK